MPHWFRYTTQVFPHHTDYAGVVWHGAYITWLEEARIACLRAAAAVTYTQLVQADIHLPVVDLTMHYHQALHLGDQVQLDLRLQPLKGCRWTWDYEVRSQPNQQLHATAQVTLVPINAQSGKILRQIPVTLQEVLIKLQAFFAS
ncbi:MAG: thioesterase family protein [Cyanobacteria bacterium P01_H01_bin.121]